jgi:hypothetical protein
VTGPKEFGARVRLVRCVNIAATRDEVGERDNRRSARTMAVAYYRARALPIMPILRGLPPSPRIAGPLMGLLRWPMDRLRRMSALPTMPPVLSVHARHMTTNANGIMGCRSKEAFGRVRNASRPAMVVTSK